MRLLVSTRSQGYGDTKFRQAQLTPAALILRPVHMSLEPLLAARLEGAAQQPVGCFLGGLGRQRDIDGVGPFDLDLPLERLHVARLVEQAFFARLNARGRPKAATAQCREGDYPAAVFVRALAR